VDTDDDSAAGDEGRGGRFRHLFDNVQDAVVEFEIVDGDPVVTRVNAAFVDVFGYEREAIVGESLNEFIVPDGMGAEAATFDDRTDEGEHNKALVRRETAAGLRRFLYRGVPYRGWDGSARGFAIYSDITDETRREHRLQVLHRLLRHNLRNEVTVIDASAELLADDVSDPTARELIEEIRARADQLEHLSHEAGRVNRVLDGQEAARRPIDVRETFERVVADYRETYPDARFEIEADESLSVTATGHLELALAELVENAVEHNDADRPRVGLSAPTAPAAADEWVGLTVTDDGPRIPAAERETAAGDEEPTQLRHGSGLGLLLVRWITDACGGTVEIGESELGGNAVRLRLKRAPAWE
jgi:PAS domain S-box-containing protein